MNNDYLFQTDQFAVSEKGIHLLRNGYNYRAFAFPEIEQMEITRGKEMRNWILILFIGIVLTGFALSYTLFIFWVYQRPQARIDYRLVAVPVIPYLLGIYSFFVAFRKGSILILKAGNFRDRFPLRQIEEQKKIGELTAFLQKMHAITPVRAL
jgi:hypothetical protein